jgi:hypothetical protein
MEERFRVKVDASAGAIEVEGPEPFVREMLERYAPVIEASARMRPQKKARQKPSGARPTSKPPSEAVRPRKPRAGAVEADKELMHKLQEHRTDLAAYLEERKVASHKEEATIIASFLALKLGRPSMDENEYVAALRTLGRRLPKVPRQVLLDAKNKNQYFYEDDSSFRLTNAGINFAEQDSLKSATSE